MNLITWIAILLGTATLAAAQPASYSRQIAPILAMNCNLCHGGNPESAAGGLSTRTWTDLTKGGNLGAAIIAGDPARSALFQFVSGARGEAHRMPLGGPPLAGGEIELIRRWIAEGASADADGSVKYRLELPAVKLDAAQPVRISCRVPVEGYIELELVDSAKGAVYTDGGAVKEGRGVSAIGAPGEWIHWNLRRAPDWPEQVSVRLTIAYAASEPVNSTLTAGTEFPAGETEVRVVSVETGRAVLQRRERVPQGLPDVSRWSRGLAPGLYRLNLDRVAILFRVQR